LREGAANQFGLPLVNGKVLASAEQRGQCGEVRKRSSRVVVHRFVLLLNEDVRRCVAHELGFQKIQITAHQDVRTRQHRCGRLSTIPGAMGIPNTV
jgi:hypothetical protein